RSTRHEDRSGDFLFSYTRIALLSASAFCEPIMPASCHIGSGCSSQPYTPSDPKFESSIAEYVCWTAPIVIRARQGPLWPHHSGRQGAPLDADSKTPGGNLSLVI